MRVQAQVWQAPKELAEACGRGFESARPWGASRPQPRRHEQAYETVIPSAEVNSAPQVQLGAPLSAD